nr:putative ribonuclease H-like domain-containing protein [Tanacetum cinerariifolium]
MVYNVPNKRVEETMNLQVLKDKPNVQGLGHAWYFDLDYLTDSLGYKQVLANHPAGTQGNKTNSVCTQDADSDSDCDEQVIIVPSYPSHSIQETQSIDTPGDKVDDSSHPSADEIFRKELAKLKDKEQRVTSDGEELRTPAGVKAVLPSWIPVPTGRVPVPAVPAGDTTVPTDDVPVHSSHLTDSMFDGEPTTRFPCPSDLGNHDPSSGIFSSLSYVDEFDIALNNVESSVEVSLVPIKRIHTIHPQSLIIGDPTSIVQTRGMVKQNPTGDSPFISSIFDQQKDNRKYAIGTKWILKNKQDARGIVVYNKARLVAQGHQQEEGIDYDEVFAPVSRIEAIRLFLAFASYIGFLVYQMDVKSAFLYGRIEKEVYVTQPKGFVDPHHPKKVYKMPLTSDELDVLEQAKHFPH